MDMISTFEEHCVHNTPFEKDKPSMIIAETVKGKGVSFMENNYKWHHKVPDDDTVHMNALMELDHLIKQ